MYPLGESGQKRRLSAILAADVAGYTRLVEQDTDRTVVAWQAARSETIDPAIAEHSGRIVKHTGDGFLAEFATIQDAVKCAVIIQNGLSASPLDFRMGINLGDVIDDGEDIHGEGVNIAARLEAIAEPGGICVSGDVYNQVRNRFDLTFDDLGEKELKHVSWPVRVYAIRPPGGGEPTPVELAISGKSSIAVLPFDNMSGDPEQEYFSDGLTEDIITALALWRSIPVIARNSTFAYKGKSLDVRTLASKLGARYVLEGSVRKSGDRLRITAQLIDATNGLHIWAEKFDRQLTDIFELQDEIVQRIAATVEPELERAEQKYSGVKKPQNLDAWDYYQRGMSYLYEFTKEGNERAREMFQRALTCDPEYSQAFSGLAYTHHRDLAMEVADDREASIAKCFEAARRGVALDPVSSFARVVLAQAHIWPDQHDLAIAEAEKALELNPNNAQAHVVLGTFLDSAGNSEDGIRKLEKGLELNPQDPRNHNPLTLLARAYLNARRYEEAVRRAREALHHHPGYPNASYILAASLGHLDRLTEARAALVECERVRPGFVAKRKRWKPYQDPADNEHILDGIRKAGLPE